jgi:FkbM family methyltransferase
MLLEIAMIVLRQLARVCGILAVPAGRRALFGPKPRSVASNLLVNELLSEGVSFRTVIDGGANVGQFARAAATGFPNATIHSFEPAPTTADILRRNLQGLRRVHVHQTALGSSAGEVTFHCNSNPQTSSILPMTSGAGVHDGIHEIQTLKVPVTTLDRFMESTELEAPILLKLDLQGYELEALHGATTLLTKCSHVLVESVFEHLYAGEPLFDEIFQYLQTQGFVFVRPLAFLKADSGRIVQMDALFRNRQPV